MSKYQIDVIEDDIKAVSTLMESEYDERWWVNKNDMHKKHTIKN
jgi:hypothetical protein